MDQIALKGGSATFAVVALSDTSMSFKWFRNGVRISGATSSTYLLSNVSTNDTADYSVEVKNSTGTSQSRIAKLVVTTNGVPVAVNDSYAATEDGTLVVPGPGVLANDVPRLIALSTTDPITPILVTSPLHGAVSLNTNGGFIYTPNTNFFGSDSFTYTAVDSQFTGNVAVVTLNVAGVNDAPIARNDAAVTTENTPVSINVVANDSDVDSTFSILTATTTNGTVQVSGGAIVFTPPAGFFGTSTFTYTISDGLATSSANVTVTVRPAPPVAIEDRFSTLEDRLLTVAAPGVLANDVESHSGVKLGAVLVSDVANGTLKFAPDGSFTYLPAPGFFGRDAFRYVAFGLATSAPVTVVLETALTTPLRFVSAQRTDAGFIADVAGPKRAVYTLFSSTDHRNWAPLTTNITYEGSIRLTDPAAKAQLRFYSARVDTQGIGIIEQNGSTGATLDLRTGKEGAQSFSHGISGDPAYSICRVLLRLSRTSVLPNTNLNFSIGTAKNGGTISGTVVSIDPASITNATSGSSFQDFEIRYATPVGPFVSGNVYYLNLECAAPNGSRLYLEASSGSAYSNGTYFRGGSDEGKDARFEIWGQSLEPATIPLVGGASASPF